MICISIEIDQKIQTDVTATREIVRKARKTKRDGRDQAESDDGGGHRGNGHHHGDGNGNGG